MLKLFVFVAVVALASANLEDLLAGGHYKQSHAIGIAAAIVIFNEEFGSNPDEADQPILTQSGVYQLIHHVNPRDCPSSFISCAGGCYQRLSIMTNHEHARELCQQLKPRAHLAVPRSLQANQCVAGLAGNKGIWLGITDIQEEGLFVGDDELGSVDVPGNSHTWSPGQPDNYNDNEDCVEMWLGHGFAEWNDQACGHTNNLPMCQHGV